MFKSLKELALLTTCGIIIATLVAVPQIIASNGLPSYAGNLSNVNSSLDESSTAVSGDNSSVISAPANDKTTQSSTKPSSKSNNTGTTKTGTEPQKTDNTTTNKNTTPDKTTMDNSINTQTTQSNTNNGITTIAEVQQLLKKIGYDVSTDGMDGPQTQAAITDFQKKNGLPADGIAGPQTINALKEKAGTISKTSISSTYSTSNSDSSLNGTTVTNR